MNNHQPNIKFTYTSSRNCASFIGLDVHLLKGELTIDLPIKLTDRHQYLNFTSSYSNHSKCPIIYSTALRGSRICSRECDFRKHISENENMVPKTKNVRELTFLLRHKGYPKNLVESEMKKSSFYMYLTINLKIDH